MVERPEQVSGRWAGGSKSKLLAAFVLANGIVLGSIGAAEAEPVSVANPAVDAEWEASWAAYKFESSQAGALLVTRNVDLPVTIDAPIDRVFPTYSNFD